VGAPAATWMLSKENILGWQNDLDAFESALYSTDIEEDPEFDPFAGMDLTMEWLPPDSAVGKFLHAWWPQATANRHDYIGKMQIVNAWSVERHADKTRIPDTQKVVLADKPAIAERPLFQPDSRPDLKKAEGTRFTKSNTALLFHGTRSVNV